MKYPDKPNISKEQLNRYGYSLRESKGTDKDAINLVNEWRAAHLYPMSTFRATLYKKTRAFSSALIAQRLKRMSTIVEKLERNPRMELSRMQDIAGLRAILPDLDSVYTLKSYYESGVLPHTIKNAGKGDYIAKPKDDGYRSVHMVFEYHGINPIAKRYNGLLVELQIRTKLQHTWATAVELAGIIRREKLKNDDGDREWLEFFKLASKVFELIEYFDKSGKKYIASPQEDPIKLYYRLTKLDKKNHITESLQAFSRAIRIINQHDNVRNTKYYIIMIDPIERKASIFAYPDAAYNQAIKDYERMEEENRGTQKDQVLVSAGKISQLKQAYPNYFPDVSDFAELIRRAEEISDTISNVVK